MHGLGPVRLFRFHSWSRTYHVSLEIWCTHSSTNLHTLLKSLTVLFENSTFPSQTWSWCLLPETESVLPHEVSSAVVDKKMTLQSSQAQTSSTGPDVSTTPLPLGSASTQNIPDDSFHELVPGCGQSMHLDESFLVSHRFL